MALIVAIPCFASKFSPGVLGVSPLDGQTIIVAGKTSTAQMYQKVKRALYPSRLEVGLYHMSLKEASRRRVDAFPRYEN